MSRDAIDSALRKTELVRQAHVASVNAQWASMRHHLLAARELASSPLRFTALTALCHVLEALDIEIELTGDCPATNELFNEMCRALDLDEEDVHHAWLNQDEDTMDPSKMTEPQLRNAASQLAEIQKTLGVTNHADVMKKLDQLALHIFVFERPGATHVALARDERHATELCNIEPPGQETHHWTVTILAPSDGPQRVLHVPFGTSHGIGG